MSASVHLSYASGFLELGMLGEAAAELALVDPALCATPKVLHLKTAIFGATGDWHSMRRCARLLVRAVPEDVQGWISLAFSTRRAVSLRAARRILLQALALHPDEPVISFNLSCYEAQFGNETKALTHLLRAIALNSNCQKMALLDCDLEPLRDWLESARC